MKKLLLAAAVAAALPLTSAFADYPVPTNGAAIPVDVATDSNCGYVLMGNQWYAISPSYLQANAPAGFAQTMYSDWLSSARAAKVSGQGLSLWVSTSYTTCSGWPYPTITQLNNR